MDNYTSTEEAYKKGYEAGKKAARTKVIAMIARRTARLYWKPVKPGVWYMTCSACDTHLGCKEDAKYCPECGAMMEDKFNET